MGEYIWKKITFFAATITKNLLNCLLLLFVSMALKFSLR